MGKDTIEAAHRVLDRIDSAKTYSEFDIKRNRMVEYLVSDKDSPIAVEAFGTSIVASEAYKTYNSNKNHIASARMLIGLDSTSGPDESGVWTIDQRIGQPRSKVGQAIFDGMLDFWERAIDKAAMEQAMIDCIKTGTGHYVTPAPKWIGVDLGPSRRCICCGAPAGEVQHD